VTGGELLERGRGVVASRWFPIVVVVLLAALLSHRLNAGRSAEAEARRLAEAEVLRQRGLLVAAQLDRAGLAAEVRRLGPELQLALAAARRAAPGSRVTGAGASSTGAVPAGGEARPTSSTPAAALPTCLLAAGDQGEVRVEQVVLETRGGNRVIVGVGEAWRLEPAPAARLFGGPFRAELSRIGVEEPEERPGWAWGVVAGCGKAGCGVGPGGAFPPLRVGRWQVEASAGVQLLGRVEAVAQLLVR